MKVKIGKRRQARENVLKILYQMEILGDELDTVLDRYWDTSPTFDDTIKKFANELVKGIVERKNELDEVIKNKLKNWNFERVAIIDRNILRMGVYEIMFRDDIPDSVSINEAIEIAKKYGDQESSRFINGILDKVAKSKL
jgi:N utilization substance protein B